MRARIYQILPDAILLIAERGRRLPNFLYLPESSILPETAKVSRCFVDPIRNGISLVVEDESFDDVAEGEKIPHFGSDGLGRRRILQIIDNFVALDFSRTSLEELKRIKTAVEERIYDLTQRKGSV